MVTRKSELFLKNFFIFNSFIDHKEGEEYKKILYYYPSVNDEIKIRDIGLTEAIIKFTDTFHAESKALHTQKTTQLFFQPEINFWMVLTLNVPYDVKVKEGAEIIEYKGSEIKDTVHRAALQQSYEMFKLFFGTFEMNFVGNTDDEKWNNLRKKFELFYSKYLLTIKFSSYDILNEVRSIHYLPLEKHMFLRIHNFINMIQETFPTIENCILFFNHQLIWSGIDSSDVYFLHEYLVSGLFPKSIENNVESNLIRGRRSIDSVHYDTFLPVPKNLENFITATKIYITRNSKLKCYHLITYKVLKATLCILAENQTTVNENFFSQLHSIIGTQLLSIATEIQETLTENTSNKVALDALGPTFLLINELSLRYKGTINLDNKSSRYSAVMNLITDICKQHNTHLSNKYEEILLESVSGFWIVKKTLNWRQFYVVIYNNQATILNITDEVEKLLDQYVKNLFF